MLTTAGHRAAATTQVLRRTFTSGTGQAASQAAGQGAGNVRLQGAAQPARQVAERASGREIAGWVGATLIGATIYGLAECHWRASGTPDNPLSRILP